MGVTSHRGAMPTEVPHHESDTVKLPVGESTRLLGAKPPEKGTADGTPQNESFGYMLLLLSALGYCILGLLIRITTGYHDFPIPCFLVIRGAMQIVYSVAWIAAFADFKATFNVSLRMVGMLTLHGFGSGVALALGLYGLSLIPFGIANSIFFISMFFLLPAPRTVSATL